MESRRLGALSFHQCPPNGSDYRDLGRIGSRGKGRGSGVTKWPGRGFGGGRSDATRGLRGHGITGDYGGLRGHDTGFLRFFGASFPGWLRGVHQGRRNNREACTAVISGIRTFRIVSPEFARNSIKGMIGRRRAVLMDCARSCTSYAFPQKQGAENRELPSFALKM